MNANAPQDKDTLDRALRDWQISASLPPRFGEGVWRRIADEASEKEGVMTLWEMVRPRLQGAFAQPAVALSYALVLVLVASGAGYWQAREKSAFIEQSLRSSYVSSVDPYQKTQM